MIRERSYNKNDSFRVPAPSLPVPTVQAFTGAGRGSIGDGMKPFKVVARVDGTREPFVDWYEAETETRARALWDEDAHRYGLPVAKTTLTVEEVSEAPANRP